MVHAPAFRLPDPGPFAVDEAFVDTAAVAARALPNEIRAAVRAFAADPDPDGVLLLRGLPVGSVAPTPVDPLGGPGDDHTSELALLAVATLLGEPVGYAQEHGGGLVQHIVPARDTEARQVSTSSAVTLAWHTETAFHPHKPRYLLLLCVRGDPSAGTLLCSIARCLPHLDAPTIATLRKPRFRTRPDESFLEPGTEGELGAPMAVLSGADDRTFTYDEDLMVGIDPGAQAALDRLGAVVRDHASTIVLETGDLLIVDNHRVVHGRTSFAARFDGTDRWLQRAFVVSDLRPSAGERAGRIITTRF
ncbi:MAG: TauD/TfdA family dioxygenase [Acidimicrobiia bacterium]